jgi:hypothetical protein
LPAEFKRLQQETQQLLEEFQATIKYHFTFVNPLENEDLAWTTSKSYIEKVYTHKYNCG